MRKRKKETHRRCRYCGQRYEMGTNHRRDCPETLASRERPQANIEPGVAYNIPYAARLARGFAMLRDDFED